MLPLYASTQLLSCCAHHSSNVAAPLSNELCGGLAHAFPQIVKVQTAEKRCPYIDLMAEADVGKPSVYVIHSLSRIGRIRMRVRFRIHMQCHLARANPSVEYNDIARALA